MTNQEKRSKDTANLSAGSGQDLRQRAEALARERAARRPEDSADLSPEDILKMLHELQVHQIELEMQNDELRTAQVEIEAGRARYFDLYDLAPVGYCTLSEKGLVVEANLTAATLLGTNRGDLIEQPISRFILKEDQNIYYLHRKKFFETGEPQECELRLAKPDGTLFWAHLTETATQAEDGAPVCRCVLSDITERKRAEKALKESEGHLRSTLDGLSAHITVLDERGEIILTNKAYRDFAERNGVEPGAVSEGTNYLAVCDTATGEHSQEAAPFAEGIREVFSGKLPSFELEYPCHSPEEKRWFVGRVTPTQGDGPRRVVIAHESISERKQAEEVQRESLQRLEFALQGGELGMWDWNPQDGAVVYSDLWAQMLEYRPDEIETTVEFFKQRVHPEDLAAVFDQLTGHVEGRLPIYESEHRFRTKSGRWLWVLDRGRIAERDKDGRPVRVTGIIADITERKRAEEALNRKHEMLVRTEATAHVGSWEWEAEGDKVTWSDELFRILGLEPADEAPPFAEHQAFYVPEDRARLARAVDECVTTGAPYDLEVRVTRSDGALRHCVVRGFPWRDAHGAVKRLYGSLQDITEIRRAEERITTLSHMLDDAPASITLHDTEGRFIFVNAATVSSHGYESMEEFMEINLHDIDVPESEALLADRFRRIAEEGEARFEVEHYRKDGSTFPLEILAKRIEWEGCPAILSIATDITERRQAETLLAASEEKFRHAFMTSPDSININRMSDGLYIDVNDGFLRIMGYKQDEVIGRTSLGLNIWKNPEDRQALVKGLQADGYVENLSAQFYRADGTIREGLMSACVMELNGEQCILSITRDVTERKQAEESLIRQQRSIKLSSRITNVFLTSSRNEVFADVLDVLLKALDSRFGFFGYIDEAGDLICPSLTRDVWDQCQVAEKSVVFPRSGWGGLWGRSLMEKQTLVANENLRIPVGHVALENALATPIVHHDNLIGQFVVANKAGGYDKEDRNLLENAAAQTAPILFAIQEEARQKKAHGKLEEQMRQAHKMEAVGRLAGGVAHDFNNMLGIIIGHADMILEEMDPGQPFYSDLMEIRKAGERSADLTRQLLAFARKQTVAPKVIDLNKTVEGMLKMLHRLIGEDIDMAWIPGEKVWPVKIDPAQIDQVLANLCVNARDAIADVGKVTIETGNSVFDEEYCKEHVGFVPGAYTLLTVSDNGCGMNSETLENIFEPFFTTKESDKGTGLGLATVYGVVKQNNGFINVYSEPGQGTTFRIYLPRHRAKEAPLPDKEAIRPAARGHETILLVEDEPAILRMTTMMLERTGYKVLAAGTPGEAIALAREHAGEIHLLMTDVVMPEMNGRDLAKNLLSLYPDLKRLFMSGYTANVIAHHGVLDEGVQFIQKPFVKQDLATKVREALDEDNLQSCALLSDD